MATNGRTIQIATRVSEDELGMIKTKMAQLGTTNFSAYARKMLIDGMVIKCDFSDMKELSHQIAGIGRNINQIALRANETRSIYKQDVDDLQKMYTELKRLYTVALLKRVNELGDYFGVHEDS